MNNCGYYISCVSLLSQHLQSPQEEFFDISFQLKPAGKIYSFSGSQKTMVFVRKGCQASSRQRINDITKKYYFSTYFILALCHSLISMFIQDLLKLQKKKSYWKIGFIIQNEQLEGGNSFVHQMKFLLDKVSLNLNTQIFLNKTLYSTYLAEVKLTQQDLLQHLNIVYYLEFFCHAVESRKIQRKVD